MTVIFNRADKTKLRQKLRKELSKCELILWYHLRNKQVRGCKFRRQVSIDNLVVDFYCPELKMAIEVDGESHYKSQAETERDCRRDAYLRSLGLDVLRFTNLDITKNLEGVMVKIYEFVDFLKEQQSIKQPPLAPPS